MLTDALDWNEAHAGLMQALRSVPFEKTGFTAPGVPYSIWQLVEHVRISQKDIVDFTLGEGYQPLKWPADYWPAETAPRSEEHWFESITEIESDLARMKTFVLGPDVGLADRVRGGEGQTVIREMLLIMDHNAYHAGQLVVLLRLAGAWTH